MPVNPDRPRIDLGVALLELQPVQHALNDPHFSVTRRPVDNSWHHADLTGLMTGFNPTLHTHFYAAESVFDRWLEDPTELDCDRESQIRLVKEVLFMAHDYLHSWAYRALAAIEPGLIGYGPVTRDNLNMQAFVLVVTEAVAVVGLDYWYLCVADVDERCGTDLGVGPRTVHYRERYLSEYRRHNSSLDVQNPRFFHQILRLYCLGLFDGFDEQDLQQSDALASWMIRELLIAPRQREVCRTWLSRLGGFELRDDEVMLPFQTPSESLRSHLTKLSELLWRKIKFGEESFDPPPSNSAAWQYVPGATVDFRFANCTSWQRAQRFT